MAVDIVAEFDALLSRPAVFKPRLSARLNAPDPFEEQEAWDGLRLADLH